MSRSFAALTVRNSSAQRTLAFIGERSPGPPVESNQQVLNEEGALAAGIEMLGLRRDRALAYALDEGLPPEKWTAVMVPVLPFVRKKHKLALMAYELRREADEARPLAPRRL
jgi:hypothetical protein